MAKKIFISPSNQTRNLYAYGNTTEAIQCGKIGATLQTALERCSFETKLMQYYSMADRVAAADKWGADLYIPVHSNAYNGKVSGTRLMAYNLTGAGYKACKAIFAQLAPITPGTSESITAAPGLYEIKHPAAPTAYIEVDFHDNTTAAKWIVEHTQDIAEAICRGVCDCFGYTYVAPKQEPPEKPKEDEASDVLYHVQLGAFAKKENAEKLSEQLKEDGYEVYIKPEKKAAE